MELDDQALDLAVTSFAKQHHEEETRCALYTIIDTAPKDLRRKAALEAITTVISEIKAGASAVACDYKLWIYLSLRLLRDGETDETVSKAIGELLKLDKIDEVWKECIEDQDLRTFLEKVGDGVKQPQL